MTSDPMVPRPLHTPAPSWLAGLPLIGPYARRPRHALPSSAPLSGPVAEHQELAAEVSALRAQLIGGRHEQLRPPPVSATLRLLLGAALAVAALLLWAGVDAMAATPAAVVATALARPRHDQWTRPCSCGHLPTDHAVGVYRSPGGPRECWACACPQYAGTGQAEAAGGAR